MGEEGQPSSLQTKETRLYLIRIINNPAVVGERRVCFLLLGAECVKTLLSHLFTGPGGHRGQSGVSSQHVTILVM